MTGCGCGGAKCRLSVGAEEHGTPGGYTNGRCRCGGCRLAKKEDSARYYAVNRRKVLADNAAYRQANPHVIRRVLSSYAASPRGKAVKRAIHNRRRERARERHCGCGTSANLAAVWALDSGRCAYCGAEGTDYDHVVPLARGGWGCISNLRVACKSCNSAKRDRPLAYLLARLAASGVEVRPGATNSGLPCPEAAYRTARRALPTGGETFQERSHAL